DVNRNTPLFSLPVELIHEVAGHLSPEAAICLTLTCRYSLDILRTSSWAEPSIKKCRYISEGTGIEHRQVLLLLLERDTAELAYCPRCNTLHPSLKAPREHRQTKLTKSCLGQDAVIDYLSQGSSDGYSLVFPHIEKALKSYPEDDVVPEILGPPIELLAGRFTIQHDRISYTLASSARRVGRNIIINHEHILRATTSKSRLRASDVLSLPLRLCPHQTTATSPPPPSRYTPPLRLNGPLLTHAIVAALPVTSKAGVLESNTFRVPTPLEREQMTAADAGGDVLWRCRNCPTKFRVQYRNTDGPSSDNGELIITTWHCFGHDMYTAQKYWKMLVRREGGLLGRSTRNSEFWSSPVRSIPDF
ncbi:hypothetical protein NA57DRAFT_25498, partial [Rhizodiscina lignyota]